MMRAAESSQAFQAIIDVDAPVFAHPADMSEAIGLYLRATGQKTPADRGAIVRIVMESLALKYRHLLRLLREMSGADIDVLHIVGGGAKDSLLCGLTAEAVGLPVVAGPAEATCTGNLIAQLVGAGVVSSVGEGRMLVRRSHDPKRYEPRNSSAWDEAYAMYLRVLGTK